MGGESILFFLWFTGILLWHYLAPGFTPYVRNLIGVVTAFAALCLFFATFRYWKIVLIIWGVTVGAFLFAEKFPKNAERQFYWREKVTFLQDFLFTEGSLLVVLEIFLLIGRK